MLIEATTLTEALSTYGTFVWTMLLMDVQDVDPQTVALLKRPERRRAEIEHHELTYPCTDRFKHG